MYLWLKKVLCWKHCSFYQKDFKKIIRSRKELKLKHNIFEICKNILKVKKLLKPLNYSQAYIIIK